MPTFADYEAVDLAPGWLQGSRGTGYLSARGGQKDLLLAGVKEAVKARMPGICPAGALPLIGRDRMLDQGPGEAEANYRNRLLGAWEAWRWSGTAFGMLRAFYDAGYRPQSGKVVLQTQGGGKQYELRTDYDPLVHAPEESVVISDLGMVHLGGSPVELWSDFAFVLLPPVLPGWASSMPADDSEDVVRIRRLIVQWKPAHARCVRLRAATVDLWDSPVEAYEPTTELWDEAGAITDWTPPLG